MTTEQKRKIKSISALSLSGATSAIGLFWLAYILSDVVIHGIGTLLRLNPDINDSAPDGVEGAELQKAFVGQLPITFTATLIGVPVGVLGCAFLEEYIRGSKISRTISILSDIMMRVPSIVVGAFVRVCDHGPTASGMDRCIRTFEHNDPIRAPDDGGHTVTHTLVPARGNLSALCTVFKVIVQVVYLGAAIVILTVIIARGAYKTAQPFFSSFNNNFSRESMSGPLSSHTVTISQCTMGPYISWHTQARSASS